MRSFRAHFFADRQLKAIGKRSGKWQKIKKAAGHGRQQRFAEETERLYSEEGCNGGGHSLGGAMSAVYAADHGDELKGIVLLAAYATKKLNDDLMEVVLYGSEDGVLNRAKIVESRKFAQRHLKGYK